MVFDSDQLLIGIVTLIVITIVTYFLYLTRGSQPHKSSNSESTEQYSESGTAEQKKKKKNAQPQPSKKSLRAKEKEASKADSTVNHPWFVGTLKGHSGSVLNLDFSLNGKYLASCADDRTVMIWLTKDFTATDHKQLRVNLSFDHADKIFWSPDSKAFLIAKQQQDEPVLEVYKLGKKPDGSIGNIQLALTLKEAHSTDIIGIALASNGKFMISGSRDGKLVFWDLKGNILYDTKTSSLPVTNCIKLSNCGRFIGVCGKSAEVVLYSVQYANKGTGSFDKVIPAFTLKGHGSDVHCIDINTDASLVATIDNKGCWRLFDTTGTKCTLQHSGQVENTNNENLSIARISNDSRILATGAGTMVQLFSTKTGRFLERVETYYNGNVINYCTLLKVIDGVEKIGLLTDIKFTTDDKFFVTSSSADRSIKIYHNIGGYEMTKIDLREQAKSSDISASVRDRLLQEAAAIDKLLVELKLSLTK